MKIAIDCRLIGQSGIGTFIENVLIHLVEMPGHCFVLIGNSNVLADYTRKDNCSVIECSYHSFTWQELLLFPVKEVNKCDAFYSPNFNLPLGIRIPVYATIHDIVFFDTENFSDVIHRTVLRWYVKRALRIARGLFTVSRFSKHRIQDYFHTSRDITVVCNGLSKDIQDYIASHTQSSQRRGIVYLGNIKTYKGLHVLWEAYKRLLDEDREFPPLTVIGRFDFRTKDLGMLHVLEENKDKVHLITNADNQQLYDLLSQAQCLISPSLYEGFGIPPLEAMSLGTPVILSDIPVYKEIYGQYPVMFFKAGDPSDLYIKMKQLPQVPVNVRELIASTYTYEKTAKGIIQKITSDTKNNSR